MHAIRSAHALSAVIALAAVAQIPVDAHGTEHDVYSSRVFAEGDPETVLLEKPSIQVTGDVKKVMRQLSKKGTPQGKPIWVGRSPDAAEKLARRLLQLLSKADVFLKI